MKKIYCFSLILLFSILVFSGCATEKNEASGESKNQKETTQSDNTNNKTSNQNNNQSNSDLIGKWENIQEYGLSKEDTEGTEAKPFEAKMITSITFSNDGKYTQETKSETNYDDGTNDTTSSVSEGSYSVSGDKITLTMQTLDGKNKEQTASEMGDMVTEEDLVSFNPIEFTFTIKGDKLTIEEESAGTMEYTKVPN